MTTPRQGNNLPILKLGKNDNPKIDSATFEFLVPAMASNLPPSQTNLNQRKRIEKKNWKKEKENENKENNMFSISKSLINSMDWKR